MSFAIFDVETRVDKALVNAALYRGRGEDLEDDDAFSAYEAELAAADPRGQAFPSIPFHVPVSIAVAVVDATHQLVKLESIPAPSEETLVRDFWARAEGFRGVLVSFNGRGFDLPVLELQALRYGIQLPRHFGTKFGARYRFQTDHHLDLLEFLTNNGAVRMRGGLEVLLQLCGLGSKGTTRGSDVQALWEAGRLDEIHSYCRRDVLATFGLFLRVQVIRGFLTAAQADARYQAALGAQQQPAAA